MAIDLMIQCSCKNFFHVYLPKQKLLGEILGDTSENWEELDSEEVAAGELELAKGLAEMAGVELIDFPETGRIKCSCGEILDLVRIMRREEQFSGNLRIVEVRSSVEGHQRIECGPI